MAVTTAQYRTILGIMLFSNVAWAAKPVPTISTTTSTLATTTEVPGNLALRDSTTTSTLATTKKVPGNLALQALYWDFPPFVMPADKTTNTSAPSGAMAKIISDIFLPKCLPPGSTIKEWTEMDSPRAVHENRDGHDIIFPITRTSTMAALMQKNSLYQFIPITESPGVSVLRCRSTGHSAIFSSLLGTWPLGLALISTAVLAGIVIWVLDTYWNPEGFPQPFSKGLWEGIWWAWVTMSTVGYGDKTPKGIPGRIFAYLWILVGIIFMSIFTATVTTAIGADISSKTSITGEKVGVLNGTTDEWLALSQGAEVTVHGVNKALWTAVKDGTLDAVLLDSLRIISQLALIESNGMESVGTINAPSVHGVLVYNMTDVVVECFSQIVDQYRYQMSDYIKTVDKRFKKKNIQHSTTELFSGEDHTWIYILIGSVLGVIIIILAGEFISKYLKAKGGKIEDKPAIKVHNGQKQLYSM